MALFSLPVRAGHVELGKGWMQQPPRTSAPSLGESLTAYKRNPSSSPQHVPAGTEQLPGQRGGSGAAGQGGRRGRSRRGLRGLYRNTFPQAPDRAARPREVCRSILCRFICWIKTPAEPAWSRGRAAHLGGLCPPELPWILVSIQSELGCQWHKLTWSCSVLSFLVSLQDTGVGALVPGPAHTSAHPGCQHLGEKYQVTTLKQFKSTKPKDSLEQALKLR